MSSDNLRELLEYIIKNLVSDPDSVQIHESHNGSNEKFELRVAKEDMGRVIGKGGRVANSIRVLLRVAAANQGKQASLDVLDPL